MGDYIVPIIICIVVITGIVKKRNVFNDFTDGAKEGLKTSVEILPALIGLMLSVGMIKASDVLEAFCSLISPLTDKIGFPPECVPLALIRPFSGSGALSFFERILSDFGPDSYIGRIASVLMGSTETTFYTIAVYFSATKIKRTSYCTASALIGDFVGFLMSIVTVKLLFM